MNAPLNLIRALQGFIERRPLGWIAISIAAGTIGGNVAVLIGWSL